MDISDGAGEKAGLSSDAGKKLFYWRLSVSGMRKMHRRFGFRYSGGTSLPKKKIAGFNLLCYVWSDAWRLAATVYGDSRIY